MKPEAISPAHPVAAVHVRQFIAQHGRLRGGLCECKSKNGRSGWFELAAADGYKLRCDWSRTRDEERIAFTEIPPPRTQRRE